LHNHISVEQFNSLTALVPHISFASLGRGITVTLPQESTFWFILSASITLDFLVMTQLIRHVSDHLFLLSPPMTSRDSPTLSHILPVFDCVLPQGCLNELTY